MDRVQAEEMRVQNFNSLLDMVEKFDEFPGTRLSDKDFDTIEVKVKITAMGLLDGVPADSGPQFFTPFPADKLERFLDALEAQDTLAAV